MLAGITSAGAQIGTSVRPSLGGAERAGGQQLSGADRAREGRVVRQRVAHPEVAVAVGLVVEAHPPGAPGRPR